MAFATAIERAGRLIMAARHGLAATQVLTVPAWRLLAAISRTQGRTSHARIARRLGISRQAVRDMVGELHERGLLATSCGPTNRKEIHLLVTPDGHDMMAHLDETLCFLLREMTRDVPRETLTAAVVTADRSPG